MTMKRVYVCSICGTERKGANHWFAAWVYEASLVLRRWEQAAEMQRLNDEDTLHVCGQACAHKLLDRFFTQGTENREPGTVSGV